MKERTTVIYGLIHPVTGELRYIGKTVQPKIRLRQHIQEASREKQAHIWSKRWIKSLLRQGLEPEMIIFEEGRGEFWREAEAFWIAYFKSLGCKLLNLAPGGIGVGEMTPALKAKRSKAAKIANSGRDYSSIKEEWVAIAPDGTRHEFLGLSEFCRQHGLETSCMTRVSLGTRKQYKGWRCWKKSIGPVEYTGVDANNVRRADRGKIKPPLKTFLVHDPNGQPVDIDRHFCATNNLDYSAIRRVARGENRSHKGYTTPKNQVG